MTILRKGGAKQVTLAGKCAIALLGGPRTVSAVILADKVIKSGRLDEETHAPYYSQCPGDVQRGTDVSGWSMMLMPILSSCPAVSAAVFTSQVKTT